MPQKEMLFCLSAFRTVPNDRKLISSCWMGQIQ
jgi:hypothetical protein